MTDSIRSMTEFTVSVGRAWTTRLPRDSKRTKKWSSSDGGDGSDDGDGSDAEGEAKGGGGWEEDNRVLDSSTSKAARAGVRQGEGKEKGGEEGLAIFRRGKE